MNPIQITKAIRKIQPDAEFSFTDIDLDSIIWHSDSERPSNQTILDMVKIVISEEKTESENKEKARLSAVNKLIDLGLTEEEAKAFLG